MSAAKSKPLIFSLVLSFGALLWALLEMLPLHDRPLSGYLLQKAGDNVSIRQLIRDAEAESERDGSSFLVVFRSLALEKQVDLAKIYGIPLGDRLNLDQRNRRALMYLSDRCKSAIRKGLDLQGGLSVTLEVAPEALAKNDQDRLRQLAKVEEVMRRRIDAMGVSEPVIRRRGNSQVEIQLAGVFSRDNPDLLDVVKKPAKLEFRLVSSARSGDEAIGCEWVPFIDVDGAEGDRLLLRRMPELTGSSVKHASVVLNDYGGYEISLEFTDEGTKRFARVTEANLGQRLGIVLDGKLYSAPVIRSAIPNGRASISGHFTQEEAFNLANVLNNPLEFELRVAEMSELGPSLAQSARTNSIKASVLGTMLVVLFMIGYYGLAGLVAVLSVILNVLIILGSLAMIGATMTLPGVAALVLTIGMSVDSNILIFSRMKEEQKRNRSQKEVVRLGFSRAFSTILDANLTTLLAAAILVFYGTGPVKGFGVILGIGVLSTMFCTLVFSRALLDLLARCPIRRLVPAFFSRTFNFDFLRWRKVSAGLSIAVIAAGFLAVFWRGSSVYGIDFTGGDEIVFGFDIRPNMEALEKMAARQNIDAIFSFQRSLGENSERLKVQTVIGQGEAFCEQLAKSFPESNLQQLQKTTIGSTVGATLRWNAIISMGLALLGILIYVAFRFEMGFAVGAIVSSVHDVLAAVGIYVLLGHQFSAPMVAAILMVIGYSINDTIVVFDRIREELLANPSFSLARVINFATNQTLSRTLLTSFTTWTAAMALYIFGSGVIVDFSLIFILGIITGTFSSIFIATPIFYWWHRGKRDKLGAVSGGSQ